MQSTNRPDAMELAAEIIAGDISSSQALEEALERIGKVNPLLNAVCGTYPEAAQEMALGLDRQLSGMDDAGRKSLLDAQPFFGVPTLLKDIGTAAIGIPSRLGSRLCGTVNWSIDSELVKRYKKAGLVFFGRTTSSEFGLSPTTESPVYGKPTSNPWGLEYSAGGSSGGAAAAVAGGMVRIAHASDGGGSIRIPASCCGVLGLKPSRGLIPMGPLRGEGWGGLSVKHMVNLSVRDCAASLDISAGADLGAPYAAPAQPVSYRSIVHKVSEAPEQLAKLRVAVIPVPDDRWPLHPDVAQVLRQASDFLAGLGHKVNIAAPDISPTQVLTAILPLIACGATMGIERLAAKAGRPLRPDDLQPTVHSMIDYARTISGAKYAACMDDTHALSRTLARFFHDNGTGNCDHGFDVLLTPVLAQPPARLGQYGMDWPDYYDYRMGEKGLISYSPFAPLANMAGTPAISIPFGSSGNGLPIGIQIMAPFGQESVLLQIAAQVEALRPWQLHAPAAAS